MKGLVRPGNALERHFVNSIRVRGPMSIATWMKDCLTHPRFGYYTRMEEDASHNVLGVAGDFVTSVEMSPMFCGMMGVWARQSWSQLGRPEQVLLAELGPGSGKLMAAVAGAMKKDGARLEVHLVEASKGLRKKQEAMLGGEAQVTWHETVAELESAAAERSAPVIVLAHEYFDALPIYRFQFTDLMGWCEEMIDISGEPKAGSPEAAERAEGGGLPLRLVLSPGPTPPAVILGRNPPKKPGMRIEVSAEAQSDMQRVARMVARGGAAIVVDYGSFGPSESSLRGIAQHQFVDPMEWPAGECDLSADVDFRMLSNVAKTAGCSVSSCLTQRDFLRKLGIEVLLVSQIEKVASESDAEQLVSQYNRVVDEMGEIYKVLVVGSSDAVVGDYV